MNAVRSTAEERRDEVIAAASTEFARTGFAGTSTEAIARRVGVSQPYLFQLFGTKKELFLAAVKECFAQTERLFDETADAARAKGLPPSQMLMEMGNAYIAQLADREKLRLQLQAYAACGDPEIRAVVRVSMLRVVAKVKSITGASPEELHDWLAEGMLANVIASIDAASTPDEFCAFLGVAAMPK